MQMRTSLPLGQTRERRRLGRRRESALLGCFLKETPVIHGAVNYHFKTDKFKQNHTCYSQSEIFVEKWRTNEHACPEQKLVESGVKLERLPLFKISISRHLWVTWLVPVIQKLLSSLPLSPETWNTTPFIHCTIISSQQKSTGIFNKVTRVSDN